MHQQILIKQKQNAGEYNKQKYNYEYKCLINVKILNRQN